MSSAIHQQGSGRGSGGFSRMTVLGLVLFGFIAFITLLYLIGAGDTQKRGNDRQAHAAANGLNGYSGLVKLLEARGEDVTLSRSPSSLETPDLLVLTPPPYFDAEEIEGILQDRAYVGPTVVILPKWFATGFPPGVENRIEEELKDGWVMLNGPIPLDWSENLPDYYAFDSKLETDEARSSNWAGFGLNGKLPSKTRIFATDTGNGAALVLNSNSNALAIQFSAEDEYGNSLDTESITFIVEPDLINNYGLADVSRAKLALALIDDAQYDYDYPIVFDLTLNGFGGATNLLTLAFRPPFLAATLCLILAIMIVGWRAFKRFGPPVATGPQIAFGKRRLVANGAGLILRARRLRLLAEPYTALSARRLAAQLGISNPEPDAIDDALRIRLPDEPPFSLLAQRLRQASKPTDILRAAQALNALTRKLKK